MIEFASVRYREASAGSVYQTNGGICDELPRFFL